MTIQTPKVAMERAAALETNKVGMCQQVTRGYYDAPSAGDRDGDRDADAIDGWLSEPAWARHTNRDFPEGFPLYFRNADNTGNGHRAISFPKHTVRSTDFNGRTKRYDPSVMGTGTLEEIERAMGLVFVGWSETITGLIIPKDKPLQPKRTRGHNVDRMLALAAKELKSSTGKNKRLVNEAKKTLLQIPLR